MFSRFRSAPIIPTAGIISVGAIAAGFGVCFFNISEAGACAAVAESYVGIFKQVGDQIIAWFFAVMGAAVKS